ncbi:2Fe-2S iron-sulfur cluster-binding protein [Embleya scabrispora]|uniref:2Fe-2S iron-sulfur cluster-binding protein n=1 Tax=Embleya scabrispora TaxID=159449 RepID=UPI00035FF9FB|nr:2Fe-2S iron-sulfur cluster-binding protein [Embleya scabrispora]MYS80734.1 2Fe-2S iron-sulfur cluster binding domain-containing protein [Streptomyces sp. SID5474]
MTGQAHVTAADGNTRTVPVRYGVKLMPELRSARVGVVGMCGGNAACGTCHVYVSPSWLGALKAPGTDEADMLDELESRSPQSRLACQIAFGPELDGIELAVAPHD